MTNLDGMLKSRDITLPTSIVKNMVFLVIVYSCEICTVNKAECQRIDIFELWCWRRLLRVPWTARRSNQSILREVNPEHLLKGLMLKLQYSGHLMGTANSLEKSLMLGKIEGSKRRGWQRMSWLDGITDSIDGYAFEWTLGVGDGQRGLACCDSWGRKESDTTELKWTELNWIISNVEHLFTCLLAICMSFFPLAAQLAGS